jgi:hypothetical protein
MIEELARILSFATPEHDPEKHVLDPDRGWTPVFGKDHAPPIT